MCLSVKSNLIPNLRKLALLTSLAISTISCATGLESNNPDIHHWGENNRLGTIGQTFEYKNPRTKDTEYFELIKLGGDNKYWYFPTDKSNNTYWQYLGVQIADDKLHHWDDNDRLGAIGNVYIYNNPYSNQTEYFELIGLGSDNKYWYFPTDKSNNKYWKYLGIDKPIHIDSGTITPPNQIIDKIPPIITINGKNPVELELGIDYTDAGATAIDDVDGDITNKITTTGEVDSNTVGVYNITYNVSDTAGNKAKSIIRIINIINNSGEGNLPPNPGSAGKQTLAGIDSNNNGVRDDVEIAIYNRYPDDEGKRNALTTLAVYLQTQVVLGIVGDDNAIFKHALTLEKPISCLIDTWDEGVTLESVFIQTAVLNTSERFDAHLKFDESLGGSTFVDQEYDNPCKNEGE